MNNARIAAVFEEIADLLEFEGANAFRVRAYRNGAHAVEGLADDLAERVTAGGPPLTDIPGIGDDLAEKIVTLVKTGELPLRKELHERIPAGVLDLLRVPGLGPKKASAVFRELGVRSLAELRAACEQQRVQTLKGFGVKTEQSILAQLHLAETEAVRLPWHDAERLVEQLRDYMAGCVAVDRLEFAGSFRRGKDTVGDLDLLVTSSQPAEVMQHFVSFPEAGTVLAHGETKSSIRLRHGFQVDLRVVPPESFGAALQYFTGSKEHNVVLRGRAKDRGLKLNEHGLFRDDVCLAGKDEAEIYQVLDLLCPPPELRENRLEFAAAGQNLPRLITREDLRGDLHMHTTATDGSASLQEMAAAGRAQGFDYIAITDHSQRVSIARGLTPERVLEQWTQIDALNRTLAGKPLILKGIEVDILEPGGLDLPDDVLAQADWVVASVHFGQSQTEAQITRRIVDALAHPSVCVVAHPTGRLLGKRAPYAVNLTEVFAAAKAHRKFLELNANPLRLDLDDQACAAAAAQGIPIVINSDSHSIAGFDVLRHGIRQARRAGLRPEQVVNTRSWPEIQQLLGRS